MCTAALLSEKELERIKAGRKSFYRVSDYYKNLRKVLTKPKAIMLIYGLLFRSFSSYKKVRKFAKSPDKKVRTLNAIFREAGRRLTNDGILLLAPEHLVLIQRLTI